MKDYVSMIGCCIYVASFPGSTHPVSVTHSTEKQGEDLVSHFT